MDHKANHSEDRAAARREDRAGAHSHDRAPAHEGLHRRAREQGANRLIYWLVRAVLQPFFLIYLRMNRIGREHIPAHGPVIIAANHRSFLDPFVIATMARRPMHYVAKKELFARPWQAWILNALGGFPVDRGAGDAETIETAKVILGRGEVVLIFPEGTRMRPGSLGSPRRGVGRLALETGAPVVPVALIGTEDVRRGLRIRPRKVRIRAGRPLRFPQVQGASPALAAAVTARIWPCVMLQWEWLGGLPPIRRAAIVGAGTWGTSLAVCLARAGFDVDLGCRTREQAAVLSAARCNEAYLPGVELPSAVQVVRAAELELGGHDLVCLAVPAKSLPSVLAAHGERIPRRAGLLVLSKGLVPPLGRLPSAFAAERCGARAVAVLGGPAHAAEVLAHGASMVLASREGGFARQLADALGTAGLDVSITTDVTGVEFAGCAKNAAVLAAAAASVAGPNVAGAAAGKVFAEVDALARLRGGLPETFAGLAGAGDLVATVVASSSRNRRAGELLAQGASPVEIGAILGQVAEAVDSVPLLASLAADARLPTPALEALAALLEGRIEPERWTATVTEPALRRGPAHVRAA
ncbi:MAG: 1-acyl-sn-glycerol-3-phosphate acyltransferase [Solirubrobacteraceae bacterium]